MAAAAPGAGLSAGWHALGAGLVPPAALGLVSAGRGAAERSPAPSPRLVSGVLF